MIKYIKKIHKDFPEDINFAAATPAAEHLFYVREDNQYRILPEEQAKVFHHGTAQLSFLCVRAQPYIFTSVSFLCTIFKAPY